MGRRQKQTAEYFPHFVAESRTKYILESRWGNDGYAFWFKLLELLCRSDGHYYDCSQPSDKLYLTAWTKVNEETADAILELLASMKNIDPDLWKEARVIWCQSLVDNLAGLYSKRTTPVPQRPSMLHPASLPAPADPENAGGAEITLKGKRPPVSGEEPTEEKKKRSGRKKPEPPEKINYAEFVSMTEAEHAKLVEKYGEEATRKLIEKLDNYKGAKGTTYKSDYRAILNWVVEEVLEKKGGGNGGTGTDRGNSERNNGTDFTPSGGFQG